jgi:alanyl-tRNA synthetase
MITERLYYDDCYLHDFDATVTAVDGTTAYLDRTAFYPSSGGQPFDLGTLDGAHVLDVVDEDDRIAHKLDMVVEPGASVRASIDWTRRFDHMQQHTGQHLLSAVFAELYSIPTLSFHMGAEVSTIELGTPSLDAVQIVKAERRANELIYENRPVDISYQHAEAVEGLRKASERAGMLRIVAIRDLDRSACGGTHVRQTGEIGSILIRKLDKVRGNIRIEFVCGQRAIARARADFEALGALARVFSCAPDEAARIGAANVEKLQDLEKSRRKLAAEVAAFEGQALHANTAAGPDGIKRAIRRAPIAEDTRTLAQAFIGGGKAILLQISQEPPSVLLAASPDAQCNCGEIVKKALAEVGGRGGGTPQSAQGSVPGRDALAQLEARILSQWPAS